MGLLLAVALLTACGSSKKSTSATGIYKPATATATAGTTSPAAYNTKLGIAVPVQHQGALVQALEGWMGVPYKYAGQTKEGTDCSGLIWNIYQQVYGLKVARSTAQLYEQRLPITADSLQMGDLVFFKIDTQKPGHSGIYLWDGYFVHASSSRGVMVSRLQEAYWTRYFVGAGRVAGKHQAAAEGTAAPR